MDPADQESGQTEQSGWMIQPPETGHLSISVAFGDGLAMTPDIKATLDAFVASLMESETESLTSLGGCGGVYDRCGIFDCNLNNCHPVVKHPCARLISCTIQTPEQAPEQE